MADVDGGRERAAQHRADDRAETVGEQDLAQVVVVAGRRRALDVVHRLGEVVDAERDRGDEQRRDLREPLPTRRPRTSEGAGRIARTTCRRRRPACSRSSPASDTAQPITEPTITATSPPGKPPGSRMFAVHAISTIAKHTRPIHGISHIWNAGRIEMNAIEIPASVPSIAARGVIARIVGPTNAPSSTMTPMMKHHARPGVPRDDRVLRLQVHRQHDQEHDDEHVRHARAVRHRGDVAAALLLARAATRDTRRTGCRAAARCRAPGRMRPNTVSAGSWTTPRQSPVSTITLSSTLVNRPKKPFQSPATQKRTSRRCRRRCSWLRPLSFVRD